MKNKVLTILQWGLVLIWVIAGLTLDKGDGFNLFKFNIAPMPNVVIALLTFILIMIGYWLQSLKDKDDDKVDRS